jgi:hypothetical protein
LALALLYASGPDLNYPGAKGYRFSVLSKNSNAHSFALEEARETLEQDPSQWLAAVALVRIALGTGDQTRVSEALKTVTAALTTIPHNATLNLAAYDLLVRLGDYKGSARALQNIDSDCGAVRHARAESSILNGDTAGGPNLYLDALRAAGPDELDRFFDDIRPFATRAQMVDYDSTPALKRATWILRFWERSAATSGISLRARVAQQILRSQYAVTNFHAFRVPVSSDAPISWIADTAHWVPWNILGELYVRHGPPTRSYYFTWGLGEYQAWIYLNDTLPKIFIFSRPLISMIDWRPNMPPVCGHSDMFLGRMPSGEEVARRVSSSPSTMNLRDLFIALSDYDPRYYDMARYCTAVAVGGKSIQLNELQRVMASEGRKLLAETVWSESAYPHYAHPLQVLAAAYQFRDQGVPVLAAISWTGVPASGKGNNARVLLTASAADSLTTSLRTDTAIQINNGNEPKVIRSVITWKNPPAMTAQISVFAAIEGDTLLGGMGVTSTQIRRDSSSFSISDLVIAMPNTSGFLNRGKYSLSPYPGHQTPFGQQFRLYYEVYGATPGANLRISIKIKKESARGILQRLGLRSGGSPATVNFEQPARPDPAGVTANDVLLGGDLDPGQYKIEITVTSNGRMATRTAVLIVAQPVETKLK